MSCAANFSSSFGVNGGLIFRKSAPRVMRSRCCAKRNGLPFTTRIVSNSPSPYMKPRSFTGTTASASDKNCPLRKTNMNQFLMAFQLPEAQEFREQKKFPAIFWGAQRRACSFRRPAKTSNSRFRKFVKDSGASQSARGCAPHFQIQRREKSLRLRQRFLVFRFGI